MAAAESLRLACGQLTPPIKLTPIAKLRHIQDIAFFAGSPSPEAVLVPTTNGFVIRIRPNCPLVRCRSSIAHEIAHTFFYDLGPGRPVRKLARSGIGYAKEEDLCKAFAREILLPRPLVQGELDRNVDKRGMALVQHIATRFRVSLELAAVRMVWDGFGFERSVFIFGSEQGEVRKYRGAGLRTPRKLESDFLDRVVQTLSKGPTCWEPGLRGLNQAETCPVDFRIWGHEPRRSLCVLLSFGTVAALASESNSDRRLGCPVGPA